ncbi:MAG TPA: methyltransferase domain-containing protein [Thermomicrobiales bacterium]|nr:methyltransferase domain-containing protein [Thermomicrobiales bacterium]
MTTDDRNQAFENSAPQQSTWKESDSSHFIDLGRVYTPRRDDLAQMFLDLIPAETNDQFTGVEIGTGAGWLCEAILRRYPRATMIGLDGSETMLHATRDVLAPFGSRFDLKQFRLEDPTWRTDLPEGLRCIVSSLVIHHLEGPDKARLFRDLFAKLAPGGALLIADVVEPVNGWGQRALARAWDRIVERQSRELIGDDSAYRQFLADHWNIYRYRDPDDIDHPSPLIDQLHWLSEAGFTGVDAWWADAGHVLFGGYKEALGVRD